MEIDGSGYCNWWMLKHLKFNGLTGRMVIENSSCMFLFSGRYQQLCVFWIVLESTVREEAYILSKKN